MSKKKYIFFDIDGTLLNSKHVIPISALCALNEAKQKGHEIFINSGRAFSTIPDYIKEINFDGFIAGTGTYVQYHGEVLYEKYFTEEDVSEIVNYSNKHNIPIFMSSGKESVTTREYLPLFIESFTGGEVKAEDVDLEKDLDSEFLKSISPFLIDDDVDNYYKNHSKISNFIYIKNPFTVAEFDKMLNDNIQAEKASFKNPDEHSGEITLASYNKSYGMRRLMDYLGEDWSRTVCLGDGFNDIDMIRETSLSIAMGNGCDAIKSIADYVADTSDADGVYKALKHFGII